MKINHMQTKTAQKQDLREELIRYTWRVGSDGVNLSNELEHALDKAVEFIQQKIEEVRRGERGKFFRLLSLERRLDYDSNEVGMTMDLRRRLDAERSTLERELLEQDLPVSEGGDTMFSAAAEQIFAAGTGKGNVQILKENTCE
jgi:hypothetical protein